MALSDEIDRIVPFESSESPLLREALRGSIDLSDASQREVSLALFTLSGAILKALFRRADEIDALRA